MAPRKRKSNEKSSIKEPPEEVINDQKDHSNENPISPRSAEGNIIPEEIKEDSNDKMVPNNNEISIFYTNYGEIWDRSKIIIDDVFSFAVATEIIEGHDHNENNENDDN